MHRFIQEIIHYRNSIEPGSVIDEAKLKEIEQKYTDLLENRPEINMIMNHQLNII